MKKRVIVFPCGSVNAIDINIALRNSLTVELFGASSIEDHGKYIYKNYIGGIPNISESNFIDEFNKILKINKIDFIIPTHDTVALFLKENEDRLFSEVISADIETTKICRYKSLTYKLFSDYEFIPKIYSNSNAIEKFPVYLKQDDGQGGKGSYIINNKEELNFYINKNNKLIISEYLPGNEVTIDCFTDKNSKLRFVCERTRERVLAGISVNSRIIELEEEVYDIVKRINDRLKFRGYWYVQLKRDKNNKYKLMEISTRMAGTSCIARNLDVNFPLLSILDFCDRDIDILPNDYSIEIDRTLINRYIINYEYERVYIDFDDTLILEEEYYNEYMFMFIYQCLNKHKEIILITKHNKSIRETLNKMKINENIFNEIIQLNIDEYKYKYMNNNKKSIFIDNSFAERELVKKKLGIPSFDTGNLECLIDWRG